MSRTEVVSGRRQFLRQSAALAGAAFALPVSRNARSQPIALDTAHLSDKMLAVHGPNANSLVVQSNDGVVLIDGGHADWSGALLAEVDSAFTRQPISTLFNTHWHPEQTGSNVTLGNQNVEIIAHENTKLWLGTDVQLRWSGEEYPALPAAGIPDTTIYDSGSVQLAEHTVDCHYMRNAHTDGDLCLFFPDDNVLVTGGAVSNDRWPVIDWWTGGWMGGMLDAFDVMLDIADENTRIMPSSGPLMSLADLQSQHEMYLTIFERIQSMLRNSYGTDEVLAALPTAEYDAQWGNPELFVTLAFHSMWGHLRDAHDTRLRNIP